MGPTPDIAAASQRDWSLCLLLGEKQPPTFQSDNRVVAALLKAENIGQERSFGTPIELDCLFSVVVRHVIVQAIVSVEHDQQIDGPILVMRWRKVSLAVRDFYCAREHPRQRPLVMSVEFR